MRRESSTVVVLAGAVAEPLLAGLARSSNVWWPPLDELLGQARHFFAGSLGESALTSE